MGPLGLEPRIAHHKLSDAPDGSVKVVSRLCKILGNNAGRLVPKSSAGRG